MIKCSRPRVVFIFKNFSKILNNHPYVIGLGIAAFNNSQTLKQNDIDTEMWGIAEPEDLEKKLEETNYNPDFIVISALWFPSEKLAELSYKYKNTTFIIVSHSNVSFMFADRNAFRLLREYAILQKLTNNIKLAGNSYKFTKWASIVFDMPVVFLPNLYNLNNIQDIKYKHWCWQKPQWEKNGVIKIGNFGATRVLKGNLTACAAAIEISKKLDMPVEFWLSAGRVDGGQSILHAIKQLTSNMPNFQVKYKEWSPWEQFRTFVGTMDLNMQVSLSESFNIVLADSLWGGVPVLASEVIEWLPENCIANLDDANQIADLGIRMLYDQSHYAADGRWALKKYVKDGIKEWKSFLYQNR